MRLFFLIFTIVLRAAAAQELQSVRLIDAAFIGERPDSSARPHWQTKIVSDAAGNRYTAQSASELISADPIAYGQAGYVRKVAPDNQVLWTVRFPGRQMGGLGLDPSGHLWVASAGAEQNLTGFVSQIDPSGKVLRTVEVEGTPTDLAIDPAGFVYVTGTANTRFQPTTGAWKAAIGALSCSDRYGTVYFACQEAFAVKLSPDGSRVVYATFIGGSRAESAYAIAVGSDGSAYIVGETTSQDFSTTPNAAQPQSGGVVTLGPLSFGDGFVVRLSADGSRALYSSYLGGAAGDVLYGVALEPDGSTVVVGRTEELNVMPGSTGSALLARFDASGRIATRTRYGSAEPRQFATAIRAIEGRLFAAVMGIGVVELRRDTLQPYRRAAVRVGDALAISVSASGIVDVLTGGGSAKTNVFAVAPGQVAFGAQYVATYDFDSESEPAVFAVVNAASYQQGRRFGGGSIAVAPGEIISIFGEKLGTDPRVLLEGSPLQVLYASETQINALVPENVTPGESTLAVQLSQRTLGTWSAEVAPVVPGLFTRPSDAPYAPGIRVAAAINEDGTVNSWAHPARAGSVVALYGTGLGALTTQGSPRRLQQHLEAYGPGGSGGGMEMLYAGEAPGLPGVQQVNVRIGPWPGSNTPVAVLVQLVFDLLPPSGERTQDGVSIFVQ